MPRRRLLTRRNGRKNAYDSAALRAGANPDWPLPALTDLKHMHLSTTKNEPGARATENILAYVQAYATVQAHILTMSEA